MIKLITVEQISPFKSITHNLNSVKVLDPHIVAAQDLDLRAFLGTELYLDLLDDFEQSPSLSVYSDLYNGSTYQYQNRTYDQPGIVAILAHFTYARYVQTSNIQSTKSGLVQKTNSEDSQPLTEKAISNIVQQAKSTAIVYQERVKLFLDRNSTDYPLWHVGEDFKRRRGSIRINAVGEGNRDGYYSKYCKGCNYHYDYCVCR